MNKVSNHRGMTRKLMMGLAGAASLVAVQANAAGVQPDPQVFAEIHAQGREALNEFRGQLPGALAVASNEFVSQGVEAGRVILAQAPVDAEGAPFCAATLSGGELGMLVDAIRLQAVSGVTEALSGLPSVVLRSASR
ncbi:MAG: hypothetical protein PVJ40_09480 [Gammaproteobacteria bacterium]